MEPSVVVLSGGLGGARLVPALLGELSGLGSGASRGDGALSVVVNVGDDFTWHGLKVCPDIDTVCYALAGMFDFDRGWGRRGDTSEVARELGRRGLAGWAHLGDTDVALSLRRSELIASGATLTQATAALTGCLGTEGVEVLPASDAPARTAVELGGGDVGGAAGGAAGGAVGGAVGGGRVGYAEWFVRHDAAKRVLAVHRPVASASADALDRLAGARAAVLAPSNPVASIGAILALQGMAEALAGVARRIGVLGLSGREPPDHPALSRRLRAQTALLEALGRGGSVADHALVLSPFVTDLVVDDPDVPEVEAVLAGQAGLDTIPEVHAAAILDGGALARSVASLLA